MELVLTDTLLIHTQFKLVISLMSEDEVDKLTYHSYTAKSQARHLKQ